MYCHQVQVSLILTELITVLLIDIFLINKRRVSAIRVAQYIICTTIIFLLTASSYTIVKDSCLLETNVDKLISNTKCFLEIISGILITYAIVNFILSIVLGIFEVAERTVNVLLLSGLGVYVKTLDPVSYILLELVYLLQKIFLILITIRDIAVLGKSYCKILPASLLLIPRRTRSIGLAAVLMLIGLTLLIPALYNTLTQYENAMLNKLKLGKLRSSLQQINSSLARAKPIEDIFKNHKIIRTVCSDSDTILISSDKTYAVYIPRGCVKTIVPNKMLSVYILYKKVLDNLRVGSKSTLHIETGIRDITYRGAIIGYLRCDKCINISQYGQQILIKINNESKIELIATSLKISYPETVCNIRTRIKRASKSILSLFCRMYLYYREIGRYINKSSIFIEYSYKMCKYSKAYKDYYIDIHCNDNKSNIIIITLSTVNTIPSLSIFNINFSPPYIEQIDKLIANYIKNNVTEKLDFFLYNVRNNDLSLVGSLFKIIISAISICAISSILLSFLLSSDLPLTYMLSSLREILFDLTAIQISRASRRILKLKSILREDYVLHRKLLRKISSLMYKSLEEKIPSKVLRRIASESSSLYVKSVNVEHIVRKLNFFSEPLATVLWGIAENLSHIERRELSEVVRKFPVVLFRDGKFDVKDIITLSILLRLTPMEILSLSLNRYVLRSTVLRVINKEKGYSRKLLLDILSYSNSIQDRYVFRDYVKLLSVIVRRAALRSKTVTGRAVLELLDRSITKGSFDDKYLMLLYRYVPVDLMRRFLIEYRRTVLRYIDNEFERNIELTKVNTLLRLLRS